MAPSIPPGDTARLEGIRAEDARTEGRGAAAFGVPSGPAPGPTSAPDPYANTVLAGGLPHVPTAPITPGTPAPISPMASSVMNAPNPFVAGMMVLVHWGNGQRYVGTVLQSSGTLVFVAFPNGQKHWIDVQYVSAK